MSINYLLQLLFYHGTIVTLDTQWQNARMFLEHIRYIRAWQQMNQIVKTSFNVSTIQSNHSLQFVTPVINRFVDDLLVNILPAGAHLSLRSSRLEIGVWYALLLSPHSVINRAQVWAFGSHTDGSMNFNKTFFFVCEQHSTCKQFASL